MEGTQEISEDSWSDSEFDDFFDEDSEDDDEIEALLQEEAIEVDTIAEEDQPMDSSEMEETNVELERSQSDIETIKKSVAEETENEIDTEMAESVAPAENADLPKESSLENETTSQEVETAKSIQNAEVVNEEKQTDKPQEIEKKLPPTPPKAARKVFRSSGRFRMRAVKGYPRSYINSSPRRIVRAYKRRAIVKHVPVGRILDDSKRKKKIEPVKFAEDSDSSDISIDREDPLQNESDGATTSLNNKLGKCGTTIKKIPINDEPAIEIIKGPPVVLDPLVQTKKIVFHSKDDDKTVKVVRVVHQPQNAKSYTLPTIPKTREVKMKSIDNIINKPWFSSTAPKKMPVLNQKVVLKKAANGTYSFVTDGRTLPPESFPKAIVYSQYEKQKEQKNHQNPLPSTSSQSMPKIPLSVVTTIPPTSIVSHAKRSVVSPLPMSSRPPPTQSDSMQMNVEDLFIIDENDNDDDEEHVPAPLPSKPPQRAARLPPPAAKLAPPEPVKYVIAQNMLMGQNDRLKIIDESSNSSNSSDNAESCGNGDLFVLDDECQRASTNRRKAAHIPANNEEPIFEEAPFHMPSRPQANIDLIDNLAKYRVLVRSMLKKLNMPQIDFSATEGDEYVNMYKMLRN